jgi:hypothetical protein
MQVGPSHDDAMADSFPYMQSVRNLPAILEKIQTAGTPPKFTQDFLKTNLGFSSSSDRSVIGVLKGLGFLTADGVPTSRYNEFRDTTRAAHAVAAGLREGWSEVFLSDQAAHERTPGQLKELFKNVSGKGESAAEKMAATFRVLAERASFSPPEAEQESKEDDKSSDEDRVIGSTGKKLDLHHDVHIHLPETSDASLYTAIFRARREELLD